MAYKTCPDCGSRIFEHGCVNCNEADYISMQDPYGTPPVSKKEEPAKGLTWLDIFKEYKPDITEEAATSILWNYTCYPFGDTEMITREIKDFFKNQQK